MPAEREGDSLIARAQRGDVAAFEGLYRSHAGRVYALCLRIAGDPGLAEDWAQEAWVRAWQRLGSFKGESAFGTWMHRLTLNLVLNQREKDIRFRRRFEFVDEYAPAEGAEAGRSVRQGPAATATEATRADHRMDLERALATLPDGARTVFVLYDVEGFKHREIAERLGVAEGTVKAQLHRARRLLREAMGS